MAKIPSFDAALLAGGHSRRLGRDKAFLEWRGGPLYAVQLRKLFTLAPERLWLSARPEQPFPDILEGVTRIGDDPVGAGPLGGLRAVLSASQADRVLVLAVDLPKMEASYLAALLQQEGGAVPRQDRSWEPLAAVYPRVAMLEQIEAALASGNWRLQDLLDGAASRGLIRAVPVSPSEAELFANLNSAQDLAALETNPRDEALILERHRLGEAPQSVTDLVAAEEPLEIHVDGHSVAVTMRTPGHDEELAAGFLLSEGLITSAADILEFVLCPELDPSGLGNVIDLRLRQPVDLRHLSRHVFTSSSCGICGKATIGEVFRQFPPLPRRPAPYSPKALLQLPEKLRAAQETFARTGGLHASALFDTAGHLRFLREDVGRHNALDKVVGHALLQQEALEDSLLLVSGRVSFELMQKALAARIPYVVALSAPSSLAVSLARESGQLLVGFLRDQGFNIYAGSLQE